MKRHSKLGLIVIFAITILIACSNDTSNKEGVKHQQETKQSEQHNVESNQISDNDKKKIKSQVLDYLAKKEKKEGRAVSNRYFSTSSISNGDWYAKTKSGEIQINDRGEPGPEAFDHHAITGAVSYVSKDGNTGFDKSAQSLSNIEGYKAVADTNQEIVKYVFTAEGEVFETSFENEQGITLSSGFAPKDHNDKDPNLSPNEQFQLTKDKDLSAFYKKTLQKVK